MIRKKSGFTLIELLIVVAIIGILAAVAIPQFAQYRIRGYNATANADIRNARTAQEALYADFQSYGRYVGVGTPIDSTTPLTLTTQDGSSNTRDIDAGLSNGVVAEAIGGNLAAGFTNRWQSYLMFMKHTHGDRIFSIDGDMSEIYWKSGTPAVSLTASGLTSTNAPDLTASGYSTL